MSEKAIIDEIKSYLEKNEFSREKASNTAFPSPFSQKVNDTNQNKISSIEHHFKAILEILGLDLNNESIAKTPQRIAKMFVHELFSGIKADTFPKLTFIPTQNNTDQESPIYTYNISVQSICEHHFLPMIGSAHVGYIPHEKMIGLSKLNRLIDHFAKRPQLQERLTMQIADCLSYVLDTQDIALYLNLKHSCVSLRGPKDSSTTVTTTYFGQFKKDLSLRQEFLSKISR